MLENNVNYIAVYEPLLHKFEKCEEGDKTIPPHIFLQKFKKKTYVLLLKQTWKT